MKYSGDVGLSMVEFEDFTKFAVKNLKAGEGEDLMFYLSANPEAGVIIPARVGYGNYGGRLTVRAKAAVCGLFTTITMQACRCCC